MKFLCRFLLLLIAALAAAGAQDNFALKDGDRVVFYGDSITDQRLYTTFTETYTLTRFPRRKIEFIHSGWGGDRVTGGGGGPIDLRLQRDVIAYRPTVVTIMLGMNDGRYRAYDQDIFNTYASGYEHIVQVLKAALPGVRLVLIEPSPYDDVTRPPTFPGGYNAVLVRYGEFLKDLARRQDCMVADLNTSVVAALEKAKAADAQLAQRIVPDRVHPGPGGHLLMAEALLKSWQAPATVAAVRIDAARKRVERAENTAVTHLAVEGGVSWRQADDALPMPVDLKDPVVALAIRSSDFVQALDQERLEVTGLKAARYELKIDGHRVESFSKEELGEGVNLTTLETPMADEAAAVHALTVKHNLVHYVRWRQIELPLLSDGVPQKYSALGSLDALEAELIHAQRTTARPKAHSYQLLPE